MDTSEDGIFCCLLVEQNVPMALAVADRAYVLAGGRIELGGPAAEIARDERVRTAYLGP